MELVLPPAAVFQSAMKTVSSKTFVVSRLALSAFFVILFPLFALAFASPVHAQTDPCPKTTGAEIIDKANQAAIKSGRFDDKVFNFNQISGTVDSLGVLLTGCSELHPSTNIATGGTGALAAAGKLVAALYASPPASGVQYFAQQIQRFDPVQPAYAQTGTIGFDALQPVQRLWSAFRNMSYIGFVLVFIIIGFMVMFRSKISPQAVATIQDSLPRIVVALILVTFSYAIAGLMIDIMFLVLNIAINALGTTGLITVSKANDVVFGHSIFGAIVGAWGGIVVTTADALGTIISKVVGLGTLGGLFKWSLGGIAGLIVGIAALFIMFRVFLMLLMSYATIIILTIFAPFLFLIQALPGNNGAKTWFKQMTANIAVFPAVALMLILAGILGGIEAFGGQGSGIIGQGQAGQFPLFTGDIDPNAIGKLIGLGILFMTPEVANLIKKRLGAEGVGFGGAGVGALAGAGGFIGARAKATPFYRAGADISEHLGQKSTGALISTLPGTKAVEVRKKLAS